MACSILLAQQIALVSQPIARADNTEKLKVHANSEQQAEPTRQDYQIGQVHLNKLLTFIAPEKISNNQKEGTQQQISILKDKCINSLKDYLYDPAHPEKLFDKLISGYTFYLFLHKQTMYYAEQLLGNDNSQVKQLKQDYKMHSEYLEKLKQQKSLFKQPKHTI